MIHDHILLDQSAREANSEQRTKQKRGEVIADLPYIMVLLSRHGGTYGWEVMEKTKKYFDVQVSNCAVYHNLNSLRKKGILYSERVDCNGKHRIMHYPKEPAASAFLETFFEVKEENRSGLDSLIKDLENREPEMQFVVNVPETMTAVSRWREKSRDMA